MRPKLHTSFKWMHRQYLIKKLTEEEIAVLAGVDQATINRWLKKLGLKK
jgi:DNA-binding MurR/RpiR family transcriptional regulator